mmetsp:Transcript_23205/g.30031  ORF Transcript_23205/g.30031 Transcript_23205/m.30031 type:complete len:372 (+) Transcript_23205:49-1164(+)
MQSFVLLSQVRKCPRYLANNHVKIRKIQRRNLSKYQRVLMVVKHTPYEQYTQLKVQGKAPKQLRWERLKDRFESHRSCVDEVRKMVEDGGSEVLVVSREELSPRHVDGIDLLIAVGGDGTVLSASHYVDTGFRFQENDGPVVLGVNSDPTRPHERLVLDADSLKKNARDERRSFGALCYATANNMHDLIPQILRGELDEKIQIRHRLAVTVRGTLSETRLPPALNDVLIAHPTPAAVSRFRLDRRGIDHESGQHDLFSLNCWSSGIWISSATGSTAAMASAGGDATILKSSKNMQYMVREHLLGENDDPISSKSLSRGIVDFRHYLQLRWNSQYGAVWVDGPHTRFDIELGDEILVSTHAIPLRLFSSAPY